MPGPSGSGEAIAITGSSVMDSYRHPEVVFLPVTDAEPCPISLCTRIDDPSPIVATLRRAVRVVRESGAGGHRSRGPTSDGSRSVRSNR